MYDAINASSTLVTDSDDETMNHTHSSRILRWNSTGSSVNWIAPTRSFTLTPALSDFLGLPLKRELSFVGEADSFLVCFFMAGAI